MTENDGICDERRYEDPDKTEVVITEAKKECRHDEQQDRTDRGRHETPPEHTPRSRLKSKAPQSGTSMGLGGRAATISRRATGFAGGAVGAAGRLTA